MAIENDKGEVSATDSPLASLERALERATGLSITRLRSLTLSEARSIAKTRPGKPLRIAQGAPFVMRGVVQVDHFVSHEEVNLSLDRALGLTKKRRWWLASLISDSTS